MIKKLADTREYDAAIERVVLLLKAYPENAQSQGKRSEQQDAFGFWTESEDQACDQILAVICDGMGGLSLGEQASQLAVESFIGSFSAKDRAMTSESLIDAAFAANEAVLEMSYNSGCGGRTGTTLAAVAYKDGVCNWVSVGDSHTYIYRKGRIELLNRDHNLASNLESLVISGRLTREEADSYGQREALTSFIGIEELKEIDFSPEPIRLEHGDCILLCTDGLYKTLSDRVMESIIKKAGRVDDHGNIAEKLVSAALEQDHPQQDNLTVLVLKFQENSIIKRMLGFLSLSNEGEERMEK